MVIANKAALSKRGLHFFEQSFHASMPGLDDDDDDEFFDAAEEQTSTNVYPELTDHLDPALADAESSHRIESFANT